MKKCIPVILLTVLCMNLFAACGSKQTAPATGVWTLCNEANNGFYAIMLLEGSNFKTMLCLDKSVAEKVVAQATMKLIFNEQNVIVDIIPQ